jgi:hypothetical protein
LPTSYTGPTRSVDSELALFARVGIRAPPAPTSRPSKIRQYFLAIQPHRASLLFAIAGARQAALDPFLTQLSLPLMMPPPPAVLRMTPSHRHPYLDHGVYDAFKTVPTVVRAAMKLEKHGILVLGQLVQMSEDDLRSYAFIDDVIIAEMKAHLAAIKLGFEMRAPAWNRRFAGSGAVP